MSILNASIAKLTWFIIKWTIAAFLACAVIGVAQLIAAFIFFYFYHQSHPGY